jgi:hypothetical protein
MECLHPNHLACVCVYSGTSHLRHDPWHPDSGRAVRQLHRCTCVGQRVSEHDSVKDQAISRCCVLLHTIVHVQRKQ